MEVELSENIIFRIEGNGARIVKKNPSPGQRIPPLHIFTTDTVDSVELLKVSEREVIIKYEVIKGYKYKEIFALVVSGYNITFSAYPHHPAPQKSSPR